MIDLAQSYKDAKGYEEFLAEHASDDDRQRWAAVLERVTLDDSQVGRLQQFSRKMKVLVLAGAWCGDCVNQCPIFARFTEANPLVQVRFLDRDDNPDVTHRLQVNGGQRVPVVVFLSDDDHLCGIFGDRTLSKYRAMAADTDPKLDLPDDGRPLLDQVTDEWLNEFERMQ
ncbi:MAG TPA: thiol reductase thioredoxin, partial [Acidimicrobiaceae bacterium]|nr:thiol reductase thioredoxin [Acidimicrobiaceae bacterium]